MKFLRGIVVGTRRRWWRGLLNGLSVVGAIWLVLEFWSAFDPSFKANLEAVGTLVLLGAVGAAVIGFLASVYEPQSVTFAVPDTPSRITIKYGDLLSESDNLLFGVNEFFDGELGDLVTPGSIHGQFIQRFCNSNADEFQRLIAPGLAGKNGSKAERSRGRDLRFEIGTTARVLIQNRRVFLFAFTHTDLVTAKASASVPDLWVSLRAALDSVYSFGNGQPLALPLIGGGQSGLNLPSQHLLRLLVLILVTQAHRVGLPRSVSVVLPQACFEELDLREIARDWKRR
jgi:hypothetical protein